VFTEDFCYTKEVDMKLIGVCIYTENIERLAKFYEMVLKEEPFVEGKHHSFREAQLAIDDSGGEKVDNGKKIALMYIVDNLTNEYERILKELPDVVVTSPPTKRPWGAYSFWFLDPDGNTVSFVEKRID